MSADIEMSEMQILRGDHDSEFLAEWSRIFGEVAAMGLPAGKRADVAIYRLWQAARATPSPAPIPEGQAERLRHIGGKMSNVMYNLGQHQRRTLTDDEAKLFFVLAKQWDDAIAVAPTVKASQ